MNIKIAITLLFFQLSYCAFSQDNKLDFQNAKTTFEFIANYIYEGKQSNYPVEMTINYCDTTTHIKSYYGDPIFLFKCDWDSVKNHGSMELILKKGKLLGIHRVVNLKKYKSEEILFNTDSLQLSYEKRDYPRRKKDQIITKQFDNKIFDKTLKELIKTTDHLEKNFSKYWDGDFDNVTKDTIEIDGTKYLRTIFNENRNGCKYSETILWNEMMT